MQALKWDGTAVPPQYLVRFQRALWSFRHQRVYCRTQQATIPMTPLPEGGLAASTLIPEAAEVCGEGAAMSGASRDKDDSCLLTLMCR